MLANGYYGAQNAAAAVRSVHDSKNDKNPVVSKRAYAITVRVARDSLEKRATLPPSAKPMGGSNLSRDGRANGMLDMRPRMLLMCYTEPHGPNAGKPLSYMGSNVSSPGFSAPVKSAGTSSVEFGEKHIETFTCLNGIQTAENGVEYTEAQFQKNVRILGWSAPESSWKFGYNGTDQHETNAAWIQAGLFPAFNTGRKTLYPGDIILAKLPSPKEETRLRKKEKYILEGAFSDTVCPQDMYVATVTPLNIPKHVTRQLERSLITVLRSLTGAVPLPLPFEAIMPRGTVKSDLSRHEAAGLLKLFESIVQGLALVEVLVNKGLIAFTGTNTIATIYSTIFGSVGNNQPATPGSAVLQRDLIQAMFVGYIGVRANFSVPTQAAILKSALAKCNDAATRSLLICIEQVLKDTQGMCVSYAKTMDGMSVVK